MVEETVVTGATNLIPFRWSRQGDDWTTSARYIVFPQWTAAFGIFPAVRFIR